MIVKKDTLVTSYTCMHVHVYTYAHMPTYASACVCLCDCVCVCGCVHVYVHEVVMHRYQFSPADPILILFR